MNELEMIKAFAELEGVEVNQYRGVLALIGSDGILGSNVPVTYYDPITDLALNCAARDKYEVDINHYTQWDCGPDGNGDYDLPFAVVCRNRFDSNTPLNDVSSNAICFAVIECILKSQGLWK